jgi:hypothetical protein
MQCRSSLLRGGEQIIQRHGRNGGRSSLAWRLVQRWLTYRRRLAIGDLFFGSYPAWITARSADWGAHTMV